MLLVVVMMSVAPLLLHVHASGTDAHLATKVVPTTAITFTAITGLLVASSTGERFTSTHDNSRAMAPLTVRVKLDGCNCQVVRIPPSVIVYLNHSITVWVHSIGVHSHRIHSHSHCVSVHSHTHGICIHSHSIGVHAWIESAHSTHSSSVIRILVHPSHIVRICVHPHGIGVHSHGIGVHARVESSLVGCKTALIGCESSLVPALIVPTHLMLLFIPTKQTHQYQQTAPVTILESLSPNTLRSFWKSYSTAIDWSLNAQILIVIFSGTALVCSCLLLCLTISTYSILFVCGSSTGDITTFLNVVFFSGVDISAQLVNMPVLYGSNWLSWDILDQSVSRIQPMSLGGDASRAVTMLSSAFLILSSLTFCQFLLSCCFVVKLLILMSFCRLATLLVSRGTG